MAESAEWEAHSTTAAEEHATELAAATTKTAELEATMQVAVGEAVILMTSYYRERGVRRMTVSPTATMQATIDELLARIVELEATVEGQAAEIEALNAEIERLKALLQEQKVGHPPAGCLRGGFGCGDSVQAGMTCRVCVPARSQSHSSLPI